MKKKETRDCFCALCRSPRRLRYSRHLKPLHYIQILILALVFSAIVYPWFAWKGVVCLPIIWAIFETVHKSLYRKDLRCPICGFDPAWYKKDVRIARQRVEEFLKENPDSPIFHRIRSEESSNFPLN